MITGRFRVDAAQRFRYLRVYRDDSMIPGYFVPLPAYEGARARGCLTCSHWHGDTFSGHVVCRSRAAVQVIGRPELGCAYWQREPGSDDE